MIRKLFLSIVLLGGLIFFTSSQMSDNGKAGRTNAPGETTCVNGCHNSYALNAGSGSISIQSPGTPSWVYTPGVTYNMSVTVSQTGVSLFGVGIEALTSTNANAGTLNITDAASTVIKSTTISGVSRRNIVHKLNGGASSNSKVFNFSWTAPAAGTGNVTFYFSGVAANGNTGESGDYVYNSSQVFTEMTCAAPDQPGSINGNVSVCSGTSVVYSISPVTGATSYTWTLPSGWAGTSSTESINVTSAYGTGDIAVVANNSCGSSPASILTVTGNALPVPVISMSSSNMADTLICSQANTYQWYLNSNMIAGANSSAYVPGQNGNYTVEVSDANGCTGMSADFAYTTLGIGTTTQSNSLSVFPNPAKNYLIVHSNEFTGAEFSIVDLAGSVVMKSTLTQTDNRIDISALSEGVYFTVIGNGDNKSITRFFITR